MSTADIVIAIAVFLMMGAVMAAIFRKIPIPYTVLLVLLGAALQLIVEQVGGIDAVSRVSLTPDIILFIFLPALIFEAGLGMQARQLAQDIAPILMLAIPALLISTFLVGYGLAWLSGIPLGIALIFGALISATDPIAVIALFKELGAPRRLTILVEGESLFNDAAAIVLFNLLLALALQGSFTATDTLPAITVFLTVFIGGALTGIIAGLVVCTVVNRLGIKGSNVLIISLSLAYISFVLAEHYLHVSGVMATTMSAITCAMMMAPRLAADDLHSLHNTWEFLAGICNTLLFILIGFSVHLHNLPTIASLLVATVLLVVAARASVIYSLVPLTVKIFKLPSITSNEQHIMWWGGLKGGLAIAMVLALPDSISQKQFLIDLTAGVVLFTLLINAPSIRLLIKQLGFDRLNNYENHELEAAITHASDTVKNSLEELVHADILNHEQAQQLSESLTASLKNINHDSSDKAELYYRLKFAAIEIQELEKLLREGVIQSITYIDTLNEKLNQYDMIARNPEHLFPSEQEASGKRALQRIDSALMQHFREKDWAAPLMEKYLNNRLQEYLKYLTTNLIIFRAVNKRVKNSRNIPNSIKQPLQQHYTESLEFCYEKLQDIREEFPAIYSYFEKQFALRASLTAATKDIRESRKMGELSTKPFNVIQHKLSSLLKDHLNDIDTDNTHRHREAIQSLSLFASLPEHIIDHIQHKATETTYLAGDTIIGEGDSGNALYILLEGKVVVKDIQQQPPAILAHLGKGHFFGEMALLGRVTRTATVEAESSCVLLRITHKIIRQLAQQHPDLLKTLEEERKRRTDSNINISSITT